VEVKNLQIADYAYQLPEHRIALTPLEKRDHSKLLVYKNGNINDAYFYDLPQLIPTNSCLVFNNTKVIHARLQLVKTTGAIIEIFCIEPANESNYQKVFEAKNNVTWKCMIGNAKKWKNEILEKIISINGKSVLFKATKTNQVLDGLTCVDFSWNNPDFTFAEVIDAAGLLPLPPYLNRSANASDEARYQTVYAKTQGSVAAPTAGLHFTDEVLYQTQKNGVDLAEITLHVGAGTFKPVKSNQIGLHQMHQEIFIVPITAIETWLSCLKNNRSIIAVGTTSVRTIESLYWHGVKILKGSNETVISINQWEPYVDELVQISAYDSFSAL